MTDLRESSPRYLLDTSVLLRIIDQSSAHHRIAVESVQNLIEANIDLCLVPQNLYELWAVMTRPLTANGLNKTIVEAGGLIEDFKHSFSLLTDDIRLYYEWERLVIAYNVIGKPSHDARLVAAIKIHDLNGIVTFNGSDFRRYETSENVTILDLIMPEH